ncbi:MAG: SGNH/GDSL hydrolase family protein [Gemmataceae bacterium]
MRVLLLLISCSWLLAESALSQENTPARVKPDGGMDKDGVYVIVKPERKVAETDRIYEGMTPVKYEPPADRWALLPKTKKKLDQGGQLTIVMLGDSIVNDTSRSNWSFHLQSLYPKLTITKYTSVRGSTGCAWFQEDDRLNRYVLDFKPDLVMIGGISQGTDVAPIREVIHKIRKACGADILLMTGPFGTLDPTDDKTWKKTLSPAPDDYRSKLAKLARDEKVELVDVQREWGEYIRATGRPVADFKRDNIHANEKGEQIIGRILVRYFAPKK